MKNITKSTKSAKSSKTKFVPIAQSTPSPFVSAMQVSSNFTTTENGALTNKSTLNEVLDWFGAGGALRQRDEQSIITLFSKAFAQDRLQAMRILYYFRDVREGQGERRTFRTILNWLAINHTEVARKNMYNVPFFGRYDDLYSLVGTPLESEMFQLMGLQLKDDLLNMKKGEPVSLLAKWMKSENTSSDESRRLGMKTRMALELTPKRYRKILSALRKYIEVLEVKMCANEWSTIDFEKVPSKASLTYRKAFSRNDKERYAEYLKSVEKGEAKINAGAVYPYEILRTISANGYFTNQPTPEEIKGADLMWKSMPNWLKGNEHKGLVIADVSGSMTSGVPNILVAVSLALYFAERNEGLFKDIWMNFSSSPTFQKFVGSNIWEKCSNMDTKNWGMSTNLQAAFDLILKTSVQNGIAQSDMPEVLYIVSDMEFDRNSSNITNYDAIKLKYASAGYKMPNVVWWNVASRNDNFPIRMDATGTALVSGCSPSILKSLLGAKTFDPMSIVYEVTNNPRYERVVV